jgi:hypothetical protein
MNEFFQVRLQYYDMRKVHLSKKLTEEWEKLDNRVRTKLFLCSKKFKIIFSTC